MTQILRINPTYKEYSFEDMGPYASLSGAQLVERMLKKEVPPQCEPDDIDNKVIITPLISNGQSSNGIILAIAGEQMEIIDAVPFADRMQSEGLAAIVLEGQPPELAPFWTLKVSHEKIQFINADESTNANTMEAVEKQRAIIDQSDSLFIVGDTGADKAEVATGQKQKVQAAEVTAPLSLALRTKKIKMLILTQGIAAS